MIFCIPLLRLCLGITNMALAHEIAVDKDFTLQKLRSVGLPPPRPFPAAPFRTGTFFRLLVAFCHSICLLVLIILSFYTIVHQSTCAEVLSSVLQRSLLHLADPRFIRLVARLHRTSFDYTVLFVLGKILVSNC